MYDYSLFRPTKTIPTLFGIWTITAHAYGGLGFMADPRKLRGFLFAELATLLMLCAGYLMNDVFDLRYDLVSRPDKVYVGKGLGKGLATCMYLSIFALALVAAALSGLQVLFALGVQMAFLAVYNVFSKRMSYLKPILITALFVSMYPFSIAVASGGIAGPRRDSLWIFPIWLFITTLAYEFYCDARDESGDSLAGRSGFNARFGPETMKRVAKLFAAVALPITLVPFALGQCHWVYLVGVMISAIALYGHLVSGRGDFVTALHADIVPVVISSLIDIAVFP